MPNHDGNELTALSNAWDALVHDAGGAEIAPAELAGTVRWLDTHRTQPAPAAAKARARQRLMLDTRPDGGVGANVEPRLVPPARIPPVVRPDFGRHSWAAAAALLLLLGVAIAGWTIWQSNDDEQQTVPAAVPTALSSPISGGVASDESANAVELLWSLGGEPDGPLEFPHKIEVDPDGNIWVLDGSTRSFHIFSPEGEYLESWGGPGSGEGQFELVEPGAVFGDEVPTMHGGATFDADGNLYVADAGNFRVQKFDRDRNFVAEWGSRGEGNGQFELAEDVAVDSEGRVYVVDSGKSTIQVFEPDGTFVSELPLQTASGATVRGGVAIVIDPQDRIWVAGGGGQAILSYSLDGDFLSLIPAADAGGGAAAIALDPDGRVAVIDQGQSIRVFEQDGTLAGIIGGPMYDPDDLRFTADLGIADDGSLYALTIDASEMVNRAGIYQLTRTTYQPELLSSDVAKSPGLSGNNGFVPTLPADAPVEFLWSVGSAGETPFLAPRDVEIASDGNLWVLDADQHSVAIFSPEGEFVELWGGEGSGEGQFQNLAGENDYGGATFDADGNYYVADTGNDRVQKFDANHQFLLAWGEEGEGDGQFEAASDVAVDSAGDVFVLDSRRSIVQIFDSEGTYLSSFPVVTASGARVPTPNRLAIDGEDRVWITNIWQARIFSYAKDGELLASIFNTTSDLGVGPHSIVVDEFGRLLVGNRDFLQIQLLDTTGTQLTQWGYGEALTDVFAAPMTGVTVDNEGNVYVINGDPGGQTHNLYKFKLKPEFWPEE